MSKEGEPSELRCRKWENLFEKYKIRGQLNTTECCFSEVNFKLFYNPVLIANKIRRTKKKRAKNKEIQILSRVADISQNNVNDAKEVSDNTISSTVDCKNNDINQIIDEEWNIIEDGNHSDSDSGISSNCKDENVDEIYGIMDSPASTIQETAVIETSEDDEETFTDDKIGDVDCKDNDINQIMDVEWAIIEDSNQSDSGISSNCKDENDEIYGIMDSPASTIQETAVFEIAEDDEETLTDDKIGDTEVQCDVNNSLNKLVTFIEGHLNSNLKMILTNRKESQLLESDNYNYWHKCAKQEMTRLGKYISGSELKAYMEHCYSSDSSNTNLIDNAVIHRIYYNLQQLLIKRELSRNNKHKFLKYRTKVQAEWRELRKVIPVEHLLMCISNIMVLIEKMQSVR